MDTPSRTTPTCLLLSDDLIFSSRITATARAAGIAVTTAGTVARLVELVKQESPRCVILDLANPFLLRIHDTVNSIKDACSPPPRLVAYGSHVDTATLRAAREAGCDVVLPRSRFVEDLPAELPRWLSAGAEEGWS